MVKRLWRAFNHSSASSHPGRHTNKWTDFIKQKHIFPGQAAVLSLFRLFDRTNARVGPSLYSRAPFPSALLCSLLWSLLWPAVHVCNTGPLWCSVRRSKWMRVCHFGTALCWRQGEQNGAAHWDGAVCRDDGLNSPRCWHRGATRAPPRTGFSLPVIIDDTKSYQRGWNETERQSMRQHRRETWSDRRAEWGYYRAKNVSGRWRQKETGVALLPYLVTHTPTTLALCPAHYECSISLRRERLLVALV